MLGFARVKVEKYRLEAALAGGASARAGRGVYGIAVAAELSGLPAQTLRLYEQKGLLTPARTDGGTRRYSEDDLTRLRRISELVAAGVNLTGIVHVLALEARNNMLQTDNDRLESEAERPEDNSATG